MKKELKALGDNRTWILVDKPAGVHPIGSSGFITLKGRLMI